MRPFTRVPLFCKLYSKGFKSIRWGGKCCDLLVMSELVIPISIACGLHKHLHFRLSLGTLESDAQVRFVLEFSLFFSLFLLVYSEGSKGSGGQVCRGLSLS